MYDFLIIGIQPKNDRLIDHTALYSHLKSSHGLAGYKDVPFVAGKFKDMKNTQF